MSWATSTTTTSTTTTRTTTTDDTAGRRHARRRADDTDLGSDGRPRAAERPSDRRGVERHRNDRARQPPDHLSPMKDKRSLWISLLAIVAVGVIMLTATLAAGWSPKLGLDLAGGLSVVYETHNPVSAAELDTITTILNERVGASSGATVSSQGTSTCPDKVHKCSLIDASVPGEKNTQQILDRLGQTAQLFFRPALCGAPVRSRWPRVRPDHRPAADVRHRRRR